MTYSYTNANFTNEFWQTFKGDMKLKELLYHFVSKYDYDVYRKIFAEEIIGKKLISKNLDSNKLLELVDSEMSKLNINKIKNEHVLHVNTQDSKVNKITIYDMDNLDGKQFEKIVAEILQHNDYDDVYVTGKTGDQGGDIIATKNDQKLVIQAKRRSIDIKVTNDAVQEVVAAIACYGCDKGIVVTNSFFTASAKALADANSIVLWDRIILSQFIEKYNFS